MAAAEPRRHRFASYNETMHRLRRCAPVALALLLAFTCSSCSLGRLLTHPRVFSSKGKPLPPGTARPLPLVATGVELNSRIVNLYNAINSFQAKVQMTPSVGSVYQGKISDSIVDVESYVLFRKPDQMRIIGKVPVAGTQMFDMVSNGTDFMVSVTARNLFITGSNSAPATSKNTLENLRPEAFFAAMLIRPADAKSEKLLLEDDTDEDHQLYKLHFIQEGTDGQLILTRAVWFDREDLSIVRQKEFSLKGEILSDSRYAKWQTYDGVRFPSHIDISRPLDNYGVTMDILDMKMNLNLTDDKFVLTQPEGSTLRRIGEAAPPK